MNLNPIAIAIRQIYYPGGSPPTPEDIFEGRAGFWPDLTPGKGNVFTTYNGSTEATQPGDMIGRIDSPYGADVVPEGDENYCLNMMVGAASGSPGNAPYEWQVTDAGTGLSRTITFPLYDDDGTPLIRVEYAGTTNASGTRNILSTTTTSGLPTNPGDRRNCKVTLRLSPGKSAANTTAFRGFLVGRNSGGSSLSLSPNYDLYGLTEDWEDFSASFTPTDGSTTQVTHTIAQINYNSGAVIDFGIDIKLPHLGKGLTPPARVQKNYWTLGGKLSFAQPTSAARPYLAVQPEGGVTNICDWSEDLTKAPALAGVTATEDSITETTQSNTHEVRRGPSLPVLGMQCCIEVLVKMEGTRNLAFRGWGLGGGNFVLFDLINGAVLQSGGPGWDISKTTITDASAEVGEPGWWWCRAVATATASVDNPLILNMVDGTNLTYTGDGTSTLRVKKTNINYGTEHKPYQLRKSANEVYQEGKRNCWYARGEGTQWMTLGTGRFGKASLRAAAIEKWLAGYLVTLAPSTRNRTTLAKAKGANTGEYQHLNYVRFPEDDCVVYLNGPPATVGIGSNFSDGKPHFEISLWDGISGEAFVDFDFNKPLQVGTSPEIEEDISLMTRWPSNPTLTSMMIGSILPLLLDTTDKPLTEQELDRIKELLAYQGGVTL